MEEAALVDPGEITMVVEVATLVDHGEITMVDHLALVVQAHGAITMVEPQIQVAQPLLEVETHGEITTVEAPALVELGEIIIMEDHLVLAHPAHGAIREVDTRICY